MYRWLRNTHLFLGLFSCLFVLMYGISSIRMAHIGWFSIQPAVSETEAAIPPESANTARAIARYLRYLMDEHGLRGELEGGQPTDSGFRFGIGRPGTFYLVNYSRETGMAEVKTTVAGFTGMLELIHETAGLYHDYALLNVWGVFVALVSLALILLALTGIYLWFKIHKERVIGLILLAISLGYSLTVIVLLRMA